MSFDSAPFYFGPPGAAIFAQLHGAHTDAPRGACVICPPWGREAVLAHRALRHLAERLATAGYVVLRFDLPGGGHSEGDDWQPDQVNDWRLSLDRAIDWLRTHTGVASVHLLGLRWGATLAWQCASVRNDVASLVALAPIVKGRAFVREQTMLQAATPPERRAHGADVLEATGYFLTADTQAAMSAVDLGTIEGCPAPRVLVCHRSDVPVDARWARHLESLGDNVQQQPLHGYEWLLVPTYYGRVPEQTWSDVVTWLQRSPDTPLTTAWPSLAMNPRVTLRHPVAGIEEDATYFGPAANRLFGIVTRPCHPGPGARRAVLLVNEGANDCTGPQRLWVTQARRWAALGHTVLRFDISGLGDSPTVKGAVENTVYSPRAVAELKLAIEHLRRQEGAADITAVGLCSGAYHLFLAAAQGVALNRVVMINPLTFHWREGMSLDEADVKAALSAEVKRQAAATLAPSKWLAVLSGRISPARIWRFAQQTAVHTRDAAQAWLHARTGWRPATRLERQLQRIARAHVPMHFIFAEGEPGLTLLQLDAGRALPGLQANGQLHITQIPDGNHVFSDSGPQLRMLSAVDAIVEAPEPTAAPAHLKTRPC